MPLNANHKKFINTVIDPLLDIELGRSKQLKKLVISLNEAMVGRFNIEDPHYHLSRCLMNPEKFLAGLDGHGDVLLYQVQRYIFAKINAVLNHSSVKKERITRWGWDFNRHHQLFKVANQSFKTELTVYDDLIQSTWDLTLPTYSDRVYKAALQYNDEGDIVLHVDFSFDYPSIEKELQIPYFIDDSEEEAAIEALKQKAENKALKLAANAVIDYLYDQGLIEEASEEIDWLECDTRLIFVNQHWFDALKSESDSFMFSALLHRNELQVRNLTSRAIINLLKEKRVDVDDVVNIPDHVRLLLEHPYYYGLAKDNVYLVDEFSDLTEEQVRVLRHPRIIFFLQAGKMTFDIACGLPHYLLLQNNTSSLLLTSAYDFYFLQSANIDWSSIMRMQAHHVQFLMRPEVVYLIKNDCLLIKSVPDLDEQRLLLCLSLLPESASLEERILILSTMLLLLLDMNMHDQLLLRSGIAISIGGDSQSSLLVLVFASILQLFEVEQYKNQTGMIRGKIVERLSREGSFSADVLKSLGDEMSLVGQVAGLGFFKPMLQSETGRVCRNAGELFAYLERYILPSDASSLGAVIN